MRRPSPFWFWIGALALPFFWVKDASFLGDQAQLILNALADNTSGRFTQVGLLGTRGLHYGPVPTYIYRALLFITHDLLAIFYLKIFLFQSLFGLCVFWFKRLFKNLSHELVLVILLSPYFLLYGRELWDNSWNLIFCPLAFASYWQFVEARKTRFLTLAAVFASLAFQTHLMALPLLIALLLHYLVDLRISRRHFCARELWAPAVFLMSSAHYLSYLVFAERAAAPIKMSLKSLDVSLLGARFFTAAGLDYFFEPGWIQNVSSPFLHTFAMAASLVIVPLSLYSIARVGWQSVHRKEASALGIVAITWLTLHTAMAMALGLNHHPHYYNSVVWVFVLFFVLVPPPRWCLRVTVLSLLVCDVSTGVMLHALKGTQSAHYGPSLEQRLESSKQSVLEPTSAPSAALRALRDP